MAAYLVVDVDDLLDRFHQKGITVDLQELAVGLRGGAALAAGLVSADRLKSIAVANWEQYDATGRINPQHIFRAAGYEVFDSPTRESLADVLIIHYFSYDPEPVDELILATTSRDLLPLINRIKTTRRARIRMWGSEDVLQGTPYADEIIFQPLENMLGLQTKNVAVYIDFENIAISLNEQGFIVNLDHLIDRFVKQAKAHGQVVKMAAYAPWGQRGALPPLVDSQGREIADEAPSRLLLANIDPVFNLPGKNSADIRIAREVITDSGHPDAADVYILASGDRDFNDVLNAIIQRGKQVILWGVRGSTSRQLANNPGVTIEYIDDFTNLQTHQSLSDAVVGQDVADAFTPSQWSSVVIQFDRLANELGTFEIPSRRLVEQLQQVGVVVSRPRGEDLVSQAISLGILRVVSGRGHLQLNADHPIVIKTRLVRDRIVRRVANTLEVRGWEYVNYGFLLKGLAMDHDLERPGMNIDDQWRSHWIDSLVREQLLVRELVPHRHNPDDLVPVIKLPTDFSTTMPQMDYTPVPAASLNGTQWQGMSLEELDQIEPETADMVRRVVISIEQFTSFRNFAWCPLGSLHRRLRLFDTGMSFQRAVEYLIANDAAAVNEYDNPQSIYKTKGISINHDSEIVQYILEQRNRFIQILLELYERNILITEDNVARYTAPEEWNWDLWFSIMETENVLNALPNRLGQYSLFRTHHTVNLVAGGAPEENE
ncbi:MAG: NYN domain-containing protein [Chloroflexi bacterium]|nr:MAG: NYN domain-containing protein [Chloroflexota bacterium]